MKAVIIGNSGSGKTWLAKQLTAGASVPIVHLDDLFWQPGGFDRKRAPEETAAMVATARADAGWIVEGVFGELAAPFLANADALVWLDMDWTLCEARLRTRGSESKAHMARQQSAAGLEKLLEWASSYRSRDDARSYAGHRTLFTTFNGPKARFDNVSDIDDFLAAVGRDGIITALWRC